MLCFSVACFDVTFGEVSPLGYSISSVRWLTRLTVCSLCIMSICNFNYFPCWVLGLDLASDSTSSLLLLTFFICLMRAQE